VRKFTWKKWLLATIVFLAVVAIALFIGFTWFMNKSKPVIDGELAVNVLEQDVSVTRDDKGVPHIFAQTDADLYRAQGYVQAQDRLFQMDLARRQASGRLSEIIGEEPLIQISIFERLVYEMQLKNHYLPTIQKASRYLNGLQRV